MIMAQRLADHEEASSTSTVGLMQEKRDKEDELILTETGFEFVGKPLQRT